jgi:signal peptidase I
MGDLDAREKASPVAVLSGLLKDYFLAIAAAAMLALLVRVYVLEAFLIPSDFMAPTLLTGDHIFVNKLAYGGLFGGDKSAPSRGEIVVFGLLADPTKDFIKRVVGVPGDTVEIRGGEIVLNGKSISRAADGADSFDEELDGRHYHVNWKGVPPAERKMIAVTVPAGQLFVLGDNRANLQDSRRWGFLPIAQLKGRASMIWFSRAMGEGASGARWSRIMTRVR